MVAGKAPPCAKFRAHMKNLKRWILLMDDYFTIIQTLNEQQQLAYVGTCTEDKEFEWWIANRDRYTILEKVKHAIREFYNDHWKPNRAFNMISNLIQTGTG